MVITGCIAVVGEPSTGSPCGAGSKVIFTPESIEKCAKTFVGMPVNCTFPESFSYIDGILDGHGDTNIGFIRKVNAKNNELLAEIVIWKDKFPRQADLIRLGVDSLGFSCEWYNLQTHGGLVDRENVTFIDEFEGVGCAILWKDAAAFSQTYIEKLAACKEERIDTMANEEIKTIVSEMGEMISAKISEFSAQLEEIKASRVDLAPIEAKVEALTAEMEKSNKAFEEYVTAQVEAQAKAEEAAKVQAQAELEEQKKEEEVITASQEVEDVVPPQPTMAQHVEANPTMNDSKEELDKIYASKEMSPLDKLRAIAKARISQ